MLGTSNNKEILLRGRSRNYLKFCPFCKYERKVIYSCHDWHSCHTGHEQNAVFGDFISRSVQLFLARDSGVSVSFGKMAFAPKRIAFHILLAFGVFFSDCEWGESYSGDIWSDGTFIDNVYGSLFSLFFLFWIKGFWIQVYHLVDSTIFSGPANCVTSYDMTSHGKSGNLLTLS